MQNAIAENAFRREIERERGEEIVVGVNRYVEEEGSRFRCRLSTTTRCGGRSSVYGPTSPLKTGQPSRALWPRWRSAADRREPAAADERSAARREQRSARLSTFCGPFLVSTGPSVVRRGTRLTGRRAQVRLRAKSDGEAEGSAGHQRT